MSEGKHTPGPWLAMESGWIEASDGDPVAMINAAGLSDSLFKEDIFNARLIAAAPDLLEACKAWADPKEEDIDRLAAMTAAAVAKAEGRE